MIEFLVAGPIATELRDELLSWYWALDGTYTFEFRVWVRAPDGVISVYFADLGDVIALMHQQ